MKSRKYLIGLIVLLFLFSRFIRLTEIPIFIDEAMYLLLGLGIEKGYFGVWEALVHGNPPFFSWFLAYFLSIFDSNPLIVGRLLSVSCGLIVTLLLFYIGKKYYSERIGVFAALIYIIIPFSLVYDRLTLIEPLIQLYGVLLLFLLLNNKLTLFIKIIAGVILGISFLSKSSSYFYLLLVPLILFAGNNKRKFIETTVIIYIVSFIIVLPLLIHPSYENIINFNFTFTTSLTELLSEPFKYLHANFIQSIHWLLYYFGFSLIIICIVGFLLGLRSKNHLQKYISLWILTVLVFEIFIAKIFYPRYLFFLTGFIALTVGISLDKITKKINKAIINTIIISIILIELIYKDVQIISDIKSAQIPAIDRWQLLEGWPSGYGVSELLDFATKAAEDNKSEFIVETYGLPFYTMSLYLQDNKNVILSNTLPLSDLKDNSFKYSNGHINKYIVINQLQSLPVNWPVKKVAAYPKVNNKNSIIIYEVQDDEKL